MSNVKSEPRWERRKEARPGELLASALELFAEKGFAATRLEDVAARAGVSKGTLYLYFDSKEELFKAVVRGGIVRAIEEGEAMIEQFKGTASELVRTIVLGWWERIGATALSGIPKLMLSEARNFPELAQFYHSEVIQRGSLIFRRALERGIEAAEFRRVDIDYTVEVMLAPIIMLSVWRHSLGCCEPEPRDPLRYLEAYLDLALAGLHNPAPPEPSHG